MHGLNLFCIFSGVILAEVNMNETLVVKEINLQIPAGPILPPGVEYMFSKLSEAILKVISQI